MILGAGLASSLQASEFDKTAFDVENSTILVSVDEVSKTETVYAVKDFEMLPEEASKEELDSLVASGDAQILESVFEASDSEFDAMSSQEAWGWFSSLFKSTVVMATEEATVVEDTDVVAIIAQAMVVVEGTGT